MIFQEDFFNLYDNLNLEKDCQNNYALYARLLTGCLNYRKITKGSYCDEMIEKCFEKLIKDCDIDQDGLVGWGKNEPTDYFQDGSINPKNTEYAFQTSLVLEALLNYCEIYSNTRAFDIIEKAFKPYLKHSTPLGLLPYSFEKDDMKYDVINTSSMIMAQMQRFYKITKNNSYKTVADRVYENILKNKIEKYVGWVWLYGLQDLWTNKENLNDLSHLLFTLEGIYNYGKYGGSLFEYNHWRKSTNGIYNYYVNNEFVERFNKNKNFVPINSAYYVYFFSRYKLLNYLNICHDLVENNKSGNVLKFQSFSFYLF
ncbi:MAG: hypothetical protein ACOC3V_03130 [bacterium]